MQPTPRRLASWVYATLFATVATYHFFVLLDAEMPHVAVLRHLAFCIIDAAFGALVWFWPRWILIPVSALAAEQFHAHAMHVWQVWHVDGQISWLGLITLIGLAALLLQILLEECNRLRS